MLNRVPFGKFNGAGGPHQWANHKLFEAVRPCFLGFSEQARGCSRLRLQKSRQLLLFHCGSIGTGRVQNGTT